MARYYNKKRTPLNLTLRSGKSAAVPPKSWIEIDEYDEGSERVIKYLQKGLLIKAKPSVVKKAAPADEPVETEPEKTDQPEASKVEVKEVDRKESEQPKEEAVASKESDVSENEKPVLPRKSRKRRRSSDE